MKKLITFVITCAVIFILSTRGEVVENFPRMKYLTHSNNTGMPPPPNTLEIIQKLDNKRPMAQPNHSLLLSLKVVNPCRIRTRSKRYVLNGSRWRDKNLTYKIINYPKRLKKSDVDAEISRAFNIWSEHSLLNFTAKSNGSVHIDISFDSEENGDPFDGPGKVVARSYYPNAGGDVYFDIGEYWTIGKRNGINLFQAAAHEIGHSLGLSHSTNNSALMAPMYRGYDPHFKLHQDDILAIQALYGKRKRTP